MNIFTIPLTEYRLFKALIENTGGSIYDAVVIKLEKGDYGKIRKAIGWQFTWTSEVKALHEVYQLVIPGTDEIQGLISLKKSEGFYEMNLVETAPQNYGKSKKYAGVLQCMVAFACKKSFEAGFNGEIAFTAKTALILHYERTLNARLIYPPNRMAIFSEDAYKLVSSYFKNMQ
jgi:hypothetical protein